METNLKASAGSKSAASQLHTSAASQPKKNLTNKVLGQLFAAATKTMSFAKNSKKAKPHSILPKTEQSPLFSQAFAHLKKVKVAVNHPFRATVTN